MKNKSTDNTAIADRVVNLSTVVMDKKYNICFSAEELARIKDHLDLHDISNFVVSYSFRQNEIFAKTYDLCCNINAKCTLIIDDGCNKDVDVNENFVVTLLDQKVTNISADIMHKLDIELIENNKVNISDLAIQYLSLNLYM